MAKVFGPLTTSGGSGGGGGGGGGGPTLSNADPLALGTASSGTSNQASRADHVHPAGSGGGASLSDSDPQGPGTAASGTDTEASRSDHVHPLPTGAQLESALDTELGSTAWKGGDTVDDGGEQSTVIVSGVSTDVDGSGNQTASLADCNEDIHADELYEATIDQSGTNNNVTCVFSGAAVIALTQRYSSAPTDFTTGISVKTAGNVSNAAGFGHSNLQIWRHTDDDKLWVAFARYDASVTIRRIARGAGAANALASVTNPPTNVNTVGQITNVAGSLQIVQRRHGTNPTVLWQTYTDGTDVSTLWGASSGTYRWRGKHPRGSSVSSPAVGDVFITAEGHFEHYSTTGSVGWYHLDPPDDWIGIFFEEDLAEYQVTANEQVASWGETISQVTSYTAGTAERYVRKGVLADLPKNFLDLPDTPSSFGSADDQLKVNSSGDGLEFFTPSDQQQSDSGSGWVVHHPITATNSLTGNPHSELFNDGSIHWNDFTITSIAKDDLIQIEVYLNLQNRFDIPIIIGPGAIKQIGFTNGSSTTWTWVNNNDRIPAAYWSGQNDSTSEDREPVFLRPSFFQANARRQADMEAFFVFLLDSGTDNLTKIRIYYSGSINAYLERITIIQVAS